MTTAQPGWWAETEEGRFPIVAWGTDNIGTLQVIHLTPEGLQYTLSDRHSIVYEPENWPHGG
jgi:hypothetical protein